MRLMCALSVRDPQDRAMHDNDGDENCYGLSIHVFPITISFPSLHHRYPPI
jgi:hypothetical protein